MVLVFDIVEYTYSVLTGNLLQERYIRRGIIQLTHAQEICQGLNENVQKLDTPDLVFYTIIARASQ